MKTLFSFIFHAVIIGFFLLPVSALGQTGQPGGSVYPEKVKKVIDSKCYGCHSVNGKSLLAKNALMWDDLPGLPQSKIIAKLDDIIKVVEKSKMPPKATVKKYPEMKLQSEESKLLLSWASAWADSLLK